MNAETTKTARPADCVGTLAASRAAAHTVVATRSNATRLPTQAQPAAHPGVRAKNTVEGDVGPQKTLNEISPQSAVAILNEDFIVEIQGSSTSEAARIRGMAVSPGFVDLHEPWH